MEHIAYNVPGIKPIVQRGRFIMEQYAIVVDNSNNLKFINLNTLLVDYTLGLDYNIKDVVTTKDNKKAYVTASDPHYLLEIGLESNQPYLKNAIPLSSDAEGIALTPNNECAIVANGGSSNIGLTGIQLELGHVFNLHVDAQAVTAATNSRVFIADYMNDRTWLYSISEDGTLTKTNQESLNIKIANLGATSDEKFIFAICSIGHVIQVLDVSSEEYFGVASKISTKNTPHSMAINKANDMIYVLEENCIEIFSFNPVAKTLSLVNTIEHGMSITPFYGVNQIALSSDETLLIFSTTDSVNIYTTEGEFLIKMDIVPNGGVATYIGQEAYQKQYDLLVTSGSELVMVDSKELIEKGRIDLATESDTDIILDSIAVTSDGATAVVSTLEGNKIFELDLTKNIPDLTHTTNAPTPTFSTAITPNNKYAVIGGASGSNNFRLYTYNLENKTLKDRNVLWHNISINPINGDIYIGQFILDRVKKFFINDEGELIYTNQESAVDDWPTFLAFNPSGSFLFVDYGQFDEYCGIDVMDTSSPDYFGLASKVEGMDSSFTIIVNSAGDTLFALQTHTVSQFAFDTVSKRLTLVNSFEHTLDLVGCFGTPKMIFNEDETELIILTSSSIVKYTTEGEWLNELMLNHPRSLVFVDRKS